MSEMFYGASAFNALIGLSGGIEECLLSETKVLGVPRHDMSGKKDDGNSIVYRYGSILEVLN